VLRFVALAAAAFLVILIAQFPASWCRRALPADVQCRQLDGSLWSGRCDGLKAQQLALGNLTWHLHPLGLLRARLVADVQLIQGSAMLRGRFALGGGGRIDAQDLDLSGLHLERFPSSQLPRGLHGVLWAQFPTLRWSGSHFEALAGKLNVQGLALPGSPLGNYQLEFPASAPDALVGTLRDTGGPLRVEGDLRLLPAPGFELNGRVAARADAAPGLADEIRYLGSPDADGMRPFSFAATF